MSERTRAGSASNNISKEINDNQQVEEVKDVNEFPQENEAKEENIKEENVEEKVEMNINATTKNWKELKQKKKEKEIVKPVRDKSQKKKINKQLLLFLVIVITCVIATIVLTIIKIQSINKAYEPQEENNVFVSENKIPDDDLKYVVTDKDTLDYGNLKCETIYIYDGNKETTDHHYLWENNIVATGEYFRISGLKDKNVEQKINDDIKSKTLEYGGAEGYCNSTINGEFNGVLSIMLQNNKGFKGLNYNLKTGEKFQLEDVLTKSAPIINMLYAGAIRNLAWDMDINDSLSQEDYWEKRKELSDMNNRDTSDYEEVLFEVSNWYKANKGNIEFVVSPTQLIVYNVNLPSNAEINRVTIDLRDYKENVAIYKRFYDESIYETQMSKGYIPFSRPMLNYPSDRVNNQFDYGLKADNFYVDAAVLDYSQKDHGNIYNKIRENSKVFVNNLITETMKEAINNPQNLYILEPQVYIGDYTENGQYYDYFLGGYPLPHYRVGINPNKTIVSGDKKDIRYYIEKAALMPAASVDVCTIYHYLKYRAKDDANMESEQETLTYFFDLEGNYVGTDPKVFINPDMPTYPPS